MPEDTDKQTKKVRLICKKKAKRKVDCWAFRNFAVPII